jgi:Family of unknown function (DUF5678)
MASSPDIQKLNRELAERINQEALANPESAYAGKYVGIANGQVVAVADTLNDTLRVLRQVEPDPTRTFFIEASRDYSVVEYIWELH